MAGNQDKAEANLQFILASLACSRDALNIDWHLAATKNGMTLSGNCQQKFKKLIESTKKYALVNGKVVDLEDGGEGTSTPATPAKRGRGGKATSTPRSGATASNGRKRAMKGDESDEDSDAEGTPVKKRATPAKRGAAKKAAEKVKIRVDVGEDSNVDDDNCEENGHGDGNNKESAGEDGDGSGDSDANEDAI